MSHRDANSYRDLPDTLTDLDERILELIAIEGNMTALALSADDLPRRTPADERTVAERCSVLYHHGFLECCNNVYGLSDRGRSVLQGR